MAPAYPTRRQAVPIMHAIAAPIQAAEGCVPKDVSFFALASDSSTDRGPHKAELIYTRTMRDGQSRTAFLGLQELQAGTAVTISSAYKQVILRACLLVEQWVGRLFWYCADGASFMQSDGNAVAGPQKEARKSKRKKRHKVLACMHACLCIRHLFRVQTH